MRSNELFPILAMTAIVSLLMVALPATPALADESLKVSPSKGEIGNEIRVSGSGYDPGRKVYIYFSNQEADEGDYVEELDAYEEVEKTTAGGLGTADEGNIDTSFDVPDELTDGAETAKVWGGLHFIYTTYTNKGKIQSVDRFTVTGIKYVYPAKGPVSTKVTVAGAGFSKNKYIEVFYNIDKIRVASGDNKTDDKGEFELTFIVPPSVAGDHTIAVEIDNVEAKAKFTVEPEMNISATSGRIGDRITLTGTGFSDRADVTATFGGKEMTTGITDHKGSFTIVFDVPNVASGTYDVKVEDQDGNTSTARFTMTTRISISPITTQASPGYVGMKMTISGKGFIPNHEITITYTSTPVKFTIPSEADGSFSYIFKAPESKGGPHAITVSDGTNTLEVTFFMESQAPPIPRLLLPQTEVKVEQPVVFDWQDVTDPSGVTYTLQLARDKNFSNMVLEEEGLTESKYTMSGEELESTKKEEPYYWRVKAVDGAFNESGWSGAESFNVGSVFVLPTWAIYLLIVGGGLLLFFIGFSVLRRRG